MNVPAKILLVTFSEQDTVMVEHISDYPDSHICGPDIVVLIDDNVIIPCQNHDGKDLENSEEGFVTVQYDDVVNESVIMFDAILGHLVEFLCQELRPTAKILVVFGVFAVTILLSMYFDVQKASFSGSSAISKNLMAFRSKSERYSMPKI